MPGGAAGPDPAAGRGSALLRAADRADENELILVSLDRALDVAPGRAALAFGGVGRVDAAGRLC